MKTASFIFACVFGLICLAPPADAQPALTTPQEAAEQVEKTGYYRIRLEGIPYGLYHETRLLYGWEPNSTARNKYATDPDQVQTYRNYDSVVWNVSALETYRREMPPGALIFIMPGGAGRAEADWRPVLEELNLIHVEISAGSGNLNEYSHAMALLAVEMLSQRYPLNRQRVYVAGLESAANTAVTTAVLSPDVFRAAWLINGGGFLEDVDVQGEPVPGLAPQANRAAVRAAAGRSQLLFFNTRTDIERAIVLSHARADQRAGFRGLTLWDEPELGRDEIGPEWLTKAIDQFDQPLHRDAERGMRKAERDLAGGRKLAALRAFFGIAGNAPTTEFGQAARAQADALLAEYAAQVAAIDAQIEAGQTDEAQRAIADLRRQWDDLAEQDIDRLTDATREAGRRGRDGGDDRGEE